MPRSLLVLLLLVAAVAGSWLARSAMSRWRDLRAAQTYELAAEARPVLVRAGAAVLCLMCVSALGVAALAGLRPGRVAVRQAVAAVGTERPAAAAPPAPAPVEVLFSNVSRPAGGELLQGEVPGPDGRPRAVRVWLPAEYRQEPAARFPVVVVHSGTAGRTADQDLPDVFDGAASAVELGRARPFVLVAPEAPSGTGHPCDLVTAVPQAVADDQALRAAVGAVFRTRPAGPDGWAVLGVDDGAPCAAAAGLTRPDLYGAAAAVSGRYDGRALAAAAGEAPAGTAARLLLAAAKRDTDGLASAREVQAALRDVGARAEVRISDLVQDYSADREQLRLVRVAMQYLTEQLPKP
ncbi:hypothetical protein [Kitasatospora sp. CB02891]|uniref:hypothetical protein n=1 Tax=Kitasatospora sp. CB02891 TaxID=2020329 RepID=UPI000C27D497|nr:hypothetical protein [Kitasatospora sp. CB02891]PJN23221.1 hypothetical protein CG736_23575 [Kitasatospora sp. CB02891]